MAATNGALTPPSLPAAPASPSIAKRKRSVTENALNGASVKATAHRGREARRPLQAVLKDILEILTGYDTQPSILNRPISSSIIRAASGEAASKRAKLASPDGQASIASLIENGSYDSLEALDKDVESASNAVLATIETNELSNVQPTAEETMLQTNVLAFRKMLKTLKLREEAQVGHASPARDTTESAGEDAVVKDEEQIVQIKEEDEQTESRTVLTLFGSAQGPKQLFSSLQQPQRVFSPGAVGSDLDSSVSLTLPLRESTLPNMISTTQVFPAPETDDRKKKVKTFGEVFAPPPNLPQLSPPKITKPWTTRGNTITFVQQDSLPKPSRKSSQSYATQNLATGRWLGYGGVDMPKDPTSPTAKQKSRQRALSTGEAQLPASEINLEAVQQAKEDALFRAAYSSFAPSKDDAAAIVPEETKNKIWWQKVGERRFHETFPIDPALLGLGEPLDAKDTLDESEDFKDAVENFVPVDHDPFLESSNKSQLEKDTEEVLREISELLELLASHQRIRNLSLNTNPRTPVIQNPSLASLAGSPSTPSSEEVDVYQMLKSQLSLLISQLPPYAVAKLNGDQLEELNISRTILIETKNYHGALEEDHLSRVTKPPALPAAANPPTLSRMGSSSTTAPSPFATGTQYARATPSMHSSTPRPVQTSQTYYSQQPPHRSPSVHYQRSSSGPAQPYQTPATSRPNFPTAQVYGQQTPRTSYSSSTPQQYYSQRPTVAGTYGGATNSQYYSSAPQPPASNRYPSQAPPNGYYQRPQNVPPMHGYGAQPMHSGSPLKTNPPGSSYNAPRPTYGTPVSGAQARPNYYGQSGIPATQYGTPQPPTPSTVPPTNYAAAGTNHQQMLLDRQQSQVAAQSQARMAAQSSFLRQGSGTPQPPGLQNGAQQMNGSATAA
ncbi:hypothetical protein CC78DRAFT_615269 [Lojkania enalia]|uniref:Uncharacterized protein n=1 Tax=Lojkania enalia TaxID=147567 RepID=A0A9P4KEG7_9PLEO|nr:hypothetical protein CC78DRAFT_615269 [Didymosphaeria enalia]